MKTILMLCILGGCCLMGSANYDRFMGSHKTLKTYILSLSGMALSLLIALGTFWVYCTTP